MVIVSPSTPVGPGDLKPTPTGQLVKDGINTAYTFDIDDITKVWKGRTLVDLADIAPDQIVQLNLGWSPGWRDKEFGVAEIWLDDAACKFATDLQQGRLDAACELARGFCIRIQ